MSPQTQLPDIWFLTTVHWEYVVGSVKECGENLCVQVPQVLANTAMVHMLIFFSAKGPLSLKTVSSSVSPEQSYGKDEQSQKQDLSGGGNEKQEKSLFL